MVKKLIVIFLSFCFLLNITAYHLIFYFRQEKIKTEMREGIRMQRYSEHETDFTFSLNDKRSIDQLAWEGDDEFSFNGEMYDVIEKKNENGRLIIRAIADNRETDLLNKVRGHWDQNEQSNKVADELFQILQSLYHSPKAQTLVLIRPSVNRNAFISLPLPSLAKTIPTPPPRSDLS